MCITPKWSPYGIDFKHVPHGKTLWVVHIWGEPLKKSLRLPLINVGEKHEDTPIMMVLVPQDNDVGAA